MDPENELKLKIENLVDETLKNIPVPRLWTSLVEKRISKFASVVTKMSKTYVEAKIKESK